MVSLQPARRSTRAAMNQPVPRAAGLTPQQVLATAEPIERAPGKLNSENQAFLAGIVDEGPIPAIHGVVRWRPAT